MSFFIGLLIGVPFGAVLMHMWHMFTDAMFPIHENGERSCPPCDHQCNQGRDCPAKENK